MFGLGLTRFLPLPLRRVVEAGSLRWRISNRPRLRDLRPPKSFSGRHVAVAGLFTTKTGLGRAAELVAIRLENQGHRVTRVDISASIKIARIERPKTVVAPDECAALDISDVVFVINPDHQIFSLFDEAWLLQKTIVGHWIWELESVPAFWLRASESYDEIWAPTDLVADVIRKAIPEFRGNIRTVSYAVELDPMPAVRLDEREHARNKLELGDDEFVVGYSFSADSNYYRKNPELLVRVFQSAFPLHKSRAKLLLRSHDLGNRPKEEAALRKLISGDDRIILFGSSNAISIRSFYSALDMYASPSRAEGYGLNLIEAAQAGIPVVCCGWRLPTDISTHELIRTTSYSVIKVQDPQGHYSGIKRAVWANPNASDMSRLLNSQYRAKVDQ
jgi:glycosyltransferase involved in cell wall biosynthesis